MQLLDRLRRHPAYWYVVAALWALVLLLLVIQVSHLEQVYSYGSPGTDDFIEYWTAGQLLRRGENPYDIPKLVEMQEELGSPYKDPPVIMWNPPWLLVWIYPLVLLPFFSASLVWLAANGALLLLSAALIWRALSPPDSKPLGIAWVATFLFVPALLTMRMGQISSIILFAVAGFFYFVARNRDLLAGACLAVATIKPHVIYLLWLAVLLWVIAERRWRVIAGGVTLLLPTLAVLTALWPNWLSGYRSAMANPPLYWETTTMGGILRMFVFNESKWAQFLPPVLGVLGFFIFCLLRRPPLTWKTDLGPLLLFSVPTAAYGWTFDQVVLLVPYLAIILWLLERGLLSRMQKAVALGGLVLIAAGMVILNVNRIANVFFFWCPWALGAVYLYVWQAREHQFAEMRRA